MCSKEQCVFHSDNDQQVSFTNCLFYLTKGDEIS